MISQPVHAATEFRTPPGSLDERGAATSGSRLRAVSDARKRLTKHMDELTRHVVTKLKRLAHLWWCLGKNRGLIRGMRSAMIREDPARQDDGVYGDYRPGRSRAGQSVGAIS
jgi:hypothetical protein